MADAAAHAKGMSKTGKTWLIIGVVVVVLVVAGILIYQYWYKPMQDEKTNKEGEQAPERKVELDAGNPALIKTLKNAVTEDHVQQTLARFAA